MAVDSGSRDAGKGRVGVLGSVLRKRHSGWGTLSASEVQNCPPCPGRVSQGGVGEGERKAAAASFTGYTVILILGCLWSERLPCGSCAGGLVQGGRAEGLGVQVTPGPIPEAGTRILVLPKAKRSC